MNDLESCLLASVALFDLLIMVYCLAIVFKFALM